MDCSNMALSPRRKMFLSHKAKVNGAFFEYDVYALHRCPKAVTHPSDVQNEPRGKETAGTYRDDVGRLKTRAYVQPIRYVSQQEKPGRENN